MAQVAQPDHMPILTMTDPADPLTCNTVESCASTEYYQRRSGKLRLQADCGTPWKAFRPLRQQLLLLWLMALSIRPACGLC